MFCVFYILYKNNTFGFGPRILSPGQDVKRLSEMYSIISKFFRAPGPRTNYFERFFLSFNKQKNIKKLLFRKLKLKYYFNFKFLL